METLKKKLKEQKEFSENKIKEFEIGKIYYGVSIGDSDLKSYYKIIARSSKQVTIQEVDETGHDKKREGEKRLGINIYNDREIFYPDGKYSMALSISADREYSLKKENSYNESEKILFELLKQSVSYYDLQDKVNKFINLTYHGKELSRRASTLDGQRLLDYLNDKQLSIEKYFKQNEEYSLEDPKYKDYNISAKKWIEENQKKINEFSAANDKFSLQGKNSQTHDCRKELSEVLSEVKSLTREFESYKNRMIVIETRIKNLMEDH